MAIFYVDDGMVASTDSNYLQGVLDTLTGMLNIVVLQTNIGKTVNIICHPC